MQLDVLSIVLVVLAAFGTAVFHSVSGFAGALLLAIAVAPIIGVKETVPVVATAMVISNSARVWAFRATVNWRIWASIFFAALPFIVLSAIIYIRLGEAVVAAILGVFLVAMVPVRRAMKRLNVKVGYRGLSAIAVPYGLLSGSTFGAGMMLAPFLLGAGLAGEYLVGTVAALGWGLNLTKSIVFGFSPLLDTALFLQGVLIGLCTIPGAYVGRWIVRATAIRVHTLFMEAVILGGGAYFLWTAARAGG